MSFAKAVRLLLLNKIVLNITFAIIVGKYWNVPSLQWKGVIMITVTKKDLVELGYRNSFAADIIKQSKELMIEKGHTYYHSRKLDRVPREAVEELLGIKFVNENTPN